MTARAHLIDLIDGVRLRVIEHLFIKKSCLELFWRVPLIAVSSNLKTKWLDGLEVQAVSLYWDEVEKRLLRILS